MNILVHSGGAAKGSWGFGCYQRAAKSFVFDAYAGVSVGCLNAGMLAMGKYADLLALWENMSNDEVYIGANILDEIRHVAYNRFVYDSKPLWEKIQKFFHIADFQKPFTFGFVSRETGLYYSATPQDFTDDENFQRAVLASASFPEVFPAVPDLYMKDAQGNMMHLQHCIDGGVAHVSPLGDVLKYNPDLIFEINCQSLGMWSDSQTDNNSITQIERDISIMEFNMADADRKRFEDYNDFASQAAAQGIKLIKDSKPVKPYRLITVTPSIQMDSLNFNHAKEWMVAGYADADKVLKNATTETA